MGDADRAFLRRKALISDVTRLRRKPRSPARGAPPRRMSAGRAQDKPFEELKAGLTSGLAADKVGKKKREIKACGVWRAGARSSDRPKRALRACHGTNASLALHVCGHVQRNQAPQNREAVEGDQIESSGRLCRSNDLCTAVSSQYWLQCIERRTSGEGYKTRLT